MDTVLQSSTETINLLHNRVEEDRINALEMCDVSSNVKMNIMQVAFTNNYVTGSQ